MAMWTEKTIASLQAVKPAAGDDAAVAGWHITGDLGGGLFHWDGVPPAGVTVSAIDPSNATVTSASDTTPIQITTSAPNTYVDGQAVLISGVTTNTNANGMWIVSVIDSTTFVLNGSSGNGSYTSGGASAFTTTITTAATHDLVTSQQVMIAGVGGTTNANGRWRITVVTPNQFSIASEFNAAWTGGGCIGDGGLTIPSSAAHGRWRRVSSDAINVRWFGATGNGTTDDTTSIQGSLCAAGTGYALDPSGYVFGGGKLQLPAGIYKVTAPLNVPSGAINSNIIIEGAGQDNTVLKGYGYYFPIIQSIWGNDQTVVTFLSVRDITIASGLIAGQAVVAWSPDTAYSVGAIITSGLSNRLLRCTTEGTSGACRPFGQLWSGVLSDPVVWITGTPSSACEQVIIGIGTGGPVGTATFDWSTDGWLTVNPATTGASVVLGASGLTAHFSAGTYPGGRYYCSPPMGYGFSTVHDTTITDNTAGWTVIDGGCGILQVNGGEVCIERVHFVDVVVGIIFDGTEVSVVRDCTFASLNGIWITGANQRQNNPAIDTNAAIDQSNVVSVEDCWFGCSQLSFASEGNQVISLSGANFEAGQWYGWTTAVVQLKVFNMASEGGYSGWFVGSLAPFNGNASYATFNATFENCLIDLNAGTGAAVQASNYAPASSGYQVLGTPFERLTFLNCYLASKGSSVFVGMGTGNGYRVIDTIWGMGAGTTPFDESSLATLSLYSDASGAASGYGVVGYGCVPEAGLDLDRSLALRSASITLSNGANLDVPNPYRASVEVTGPSAAFSISGIVGGTEGQVLEIVNLSDQQMAINHQDPAETTASRRFICPDGPPALTLAASPGGFNWVRVKYSSSQSRWLVLDHS